MKKYDVWLLDSESATLIEVENNLTLSEAKNWWRLWRKLRSECVCVIIPVGFKTPISFESIPKATQSLVA